MLILVLHWCSRGRRLAGEHGHGVLMDTVNCAGSQLLLSENLQEPLPSEEHISSACNRIRRCLVQGCRESGVGDCVAGLL